MFCYKCGNKCSDTAKFCVSCGTMLQMTVPQQIVEEETVAVAEQASEPVVGQPVDVMAEPVVEHSASQEELREEYVAEEAGMQPTESQEENVSTVFTQQFTQQTMAEEPFDPEGATVLLNSSMYESNDFNSATETPAQEETVYPQAEVQQAPVQPQTEQQTPIYSQNQTYSQIPPVEENAKPEKAKKIKKEKSAAAVFFSTFFSVIFMLLLVVLNVALLVRITCGGLTASSTDTGLFQEVDLKTLPVGEMVSSMQIEGVEIEEDADLADIVYDTLQSTDVKVESKEQVEELLENINIDGLLDGVKEEYLKMLTGEQESASIKVEEITAFVEENKREIENAFEIEISDEDIELVGEYLEENDIESMTKIELPEESKQITETVQLVVGDNVILYVILGAAMAVVLLLILACNLDRKRSVFVYAGISLIIAAGIALLVSLLKDTLLSMVVEIDNVLIDGIIAGVGGMINKNAYIFLATGGALMVLYFVCELIIRLIHRNDE